MKAQVKVSPAAGPRRLALLLAALALASVLLTSCKDTTQPQETGTCMVAGEVKATRVTRNWCLNTYPGTGTWTADT